MATFEGKKDMTHVACIFGVNVYLKDETIDKLKKEFPVEWEYKKTIDVILEKVIPVCRIKSEMKKK